MFFFSQKSFAAVCLVGSALVAVGHGQHVRTFFDAPNAKYSTEYQVDHRASLPSHNNRPSADFRSFDHTHQRVATFTPAAAPVQQVFHTQYANQVRSKFDLPPPLPVARVNSYPSTYSVSAPLQAAPAIPAAPIARISAPIRPAVYERQVENYARIPYSFDYSVNDAEGSHGRTESGDANGRVVGSYQITLADGRKRTVHYEADHNGYRARVDTNEFGTESQSPADVDLYSSAIPAKEATLQFERQRVIKA